MGAPTRTYIESAHVIKYAQKWMVNICLRFLLNEELLESEHPLRLGYCAHSGRKRPSKGTNLVKNVVKTGACADECF